MSVVHCDGSTATPAFNVTSLLTTIPADDRNRHVLLVQLPKATIPISIAIQQTDSYWVILDGDRRPLLGTGFGTTDIFEAVVFIHMTIKSDGTTHINPDTFIHN
jgi:hypothetical protein